MMSLRYLISTILTVLAVLVGCSQTETIVIDSEAIRVKPTTESPSRQTTASNVRIRLGETEAISSLDPLFANTNSAKRVTGLIYQGLVRLDSDGEIIPGLASSWQVGSDSLVYTFHVNPDASFQDSPHFVDGRGRAVTAQDVKASFTRMTNASVPPTAVSLFSPMIQGMDVYNREQRELFSRSDRAISKIQGIQIVDNRTVRFILTDKYPEFLELLATPYAFITPREFDNLGEMPIGSGPYRFVRQQSDSLFVLELSPSYWNGKNETHPLQLEVLHFNNESAVLQALRSNRVDIVADLSPINRMTVFTSQSQLNSDILPDFNLLETTGYDEIRVLFNPQNAKGLSNEHGRMLLNLLTSDSLESRFQHLGIFETGRQPSAQLQTLREYQLRNENESSGLATISFFSSNYEGFVARNFIQEIDQQFPVAIVRSGVASREITWKVSYSAALHSNSLRQNELADNELIRFGVTRYAIFHNRIRRLQLNGYPWWLNLDGIHIDQTLTQR